MFGASLGVGIGLDYIADLVAKYGAEVVANNVCNNDPRLKSSYEKTFYYVGALVAQHGVKAGLKKATAAKTEQKRERTIDDKKRLDDFVRARIEDHQFIKTHGTKSGRPTWKSGTGKDTRYYQKSDEGWELEVYNKYGKHIGVLKSDGIFHPEMAVEGRTIDVR